MVNERSLSSARVSNVQQIFKGEFFDLSRVSFIQLEKLQHLFQCYCLDERASLSDRIATLLQKDHWFH